MPPARRVAPGARARRCAGPAAATPGPARAPRRGAGSARCPGTRAVSSPCGRPSPGATGWSTPTSSTSSGASRPSATPVEGSKPLRQWPVSESVLGSVSGLLDAALVRVDDDLGQPRRAAAAHRARRRPHAGRGRGRPRARPGTARPALPRRRAARPTTGSRGRAPSPPAAASSSSSTTCAPPSTGPSGTGAAATGDSSGPDDRTELGVRLCYSLTWFWYLTGYGAESRRWLEQASRAASVARGPELPQLLNALGLLQLQQGHVEASRDVIARALALWREAGDRDGEALALNGLGAVHRALGEHELSRELLRESIAVGRELSDRAREATALPTSRSWRSTRGTPRRRSTCSPAPRRSTPSGATPGGWRPTAPTGSSRSSTSGRVAEASAVLRDLAPSVEQYGRPRPGPGRARPRRRDRGAGRPARTGACGSPLRRAAAFGRAARRWHRRTSSSSSGRPGSQQGGGRRRWLALEEEGRRLTGRPGPRGGHRAAGRMTPGVRRRIRRTPVSNPGGLVRHRGEVAATARPRRRRPP